MTHIRPNTRKQGSQFEVLAVEFLKKQGLQIIEQNVHMKFAEIDIVARDNNILCFVEVRSRTHSRFGAPEASVDYRKQNKIIKAASAYLQRCHPQAPMCRFDVVAIKGSPEKPEITYYKNAFGIEAQTSGRRRGSPWQVY